MSKLRSVLQEQKAEQTDIRSCPGTVKSVVSNLLNMKIQVL
jgi:hypothetical protein